MCAGSLALGPFGIRVDGALDLHLVKEDVTWAVGVPNRSPSPSTSGAERASQIILAPMPART
jgi:hypothetical protein